MSTDIALAIIGYPKEVWIVPKNLTVLVVRGSSPISSHITSGILVFVMVKLIQNIKNYFYFRRNQNV